MLTSIIVIDCEPQNSVHGLSIRPSYSPLLVSLIPGLHVHVMAVNPQPTFIFTEAHMPHLQ